MIMALFTVRPTRVDEEVAGAVAAHTDRRFEDVARVVTWGADEHVLIAAAAAAWLLTRDSNEQTRRLGTHFLACTLAAALVPHILKAFVDQERPDRLTVQGHLRGIPFSGKENDAFPSGHALHVGALASAATLLPPGIRGAIWTAGAILAATRVVLLAHWVSDVFAGLGLGALLERGIRLFTKPTSFSRIRSP
jgi:membrane-associated phospholipid phosphatase